MTITTLYRNAAPPSYRNNYLGVRLARVPVGKELASIEAATVLADLKSGDQPRILARLTALLSQTPVVPDKEISRSIEALVAPPNNNLIRFAATKALIGWVVPESAPALAKALEEDEDILVRGNVMEALARLKTAPAAKVIARKLSTLDRIKASEVLRTLGPMAEPAVLDLATDKDMLARMEVCKILKDIGTAKSVSVLTALQKDEAALVRYEAAQALKAITARK